jgi:RNA polymerase sigma factor for flagellar operon FliA
MNRQAHNDPLYEQQLWQAYRSDPSEQNREALILLYLPFVKYICGRIAIELPSHVKSDELLASGVMGLLDALDKFDDTRDNQFRTYAFTRIRGSVFDELRRMDWAPRTLRRKMRELEQIESGLEQKLNRKPDIEEIAEAAGMETAEVSSIYQDARSTVLLSLDEVLHLDDGQKELRRVDTVADEKIDAPNESLEKREVRDLLSGQIRRLPQKEQTVLMLYYYEELTLKEIGAVMHVSESRVCQIHAQAIECIARGMRQELGLNEKGEKF